MKHILIDNETHKELMFWKLYNDYKNVDQTIWELLQNAKRNHTEQSE